MRWLILGKMKKIGEADEKVKEQTIERVFQFVRGETNLEADKVRKEMQQEVDYL